MLDLGSRSEKCDPMHEKYCRYLRRCEQPLSFGPASHLAQVMTFKSPGETLTIFTIPLELTHRILTFCRPRDVAVFSRTCRVAHELAQDDYLWQRLWHDYPFDDPDVILSRRQAVNLPTAKFGAWRMELTRRMKAEFIATMKWKDLSHVSIRDKRDALDILTSVVSEALPALEDSSISANMQWLDTVLHKSELVMPKTTAVDSPPEILKRQAHLRSCIDPARVNRTARRMFVRRNEGRIFVYDLRNYNSRNDFGPLDTNGNVNWVHIEHLINVILANIRDLSSHLAPPLELESLRAYTAPGQYFLQDWAGVEGTWRRCICYMDYRDLRAFNYPDIQHPTEDGPLHPNLFEDPHFREATRLIDVKLRVVPRDSMRFLLPWDDLSSAGPEFPLIFFSGISRGSTGNESLVEGFVRMANDRTVRWKLISIYDDGPQWSFHGVQIGDVGSAKGIIGVWTTTTHEIGDPAGPSWLWKVPEGYSEDLIDYV